MKLNKAALVSTLLGILLIPACASYNYVEPKIATAAVVFNQFQRVGDNLSPNWNAFMLESIDGQFIEHTQDRTDMKRAKSRYAVMPGKHTFVIQAEFNRVFGGKGPYEAQLTVEADLDTNKEYVVSGGIGDKTIAVWIEEKRSGEPVSEVASAIYDVKPKEPDLMKQFTHNN